MIEQRSPEWHAMRLGRVTGTRIGALMGHSNFTTRAEAIAQMVLERKTGQAVKIKPTAPMIYGTNNEPIAFEAYKDLTFGGGGVREASIYIHPENPLFAASPDGLIGDDGLLEIKCPYRYRHGAPDAWTPCAQQPGYFDQVQWCLYVTDRKWCDFFQWSPSGAPHLERVYRDDLYIEGLIAEALRALTEVEAEIQGTSESDPAENYDQAIAEIARLKEELKEAEGRAAAALDLLADRHGEGFKFADGRTLIRKVSAGSVSYATIVKGLLASNVLTEEEVEKHRGDPRETWTVEVPKKKTRSTKIAADPQ